ncbi:MAG: TIGR04282 family arsenosugar biosynthesis glycosyltransferase [Gammaproteobacteria bacterium]|nr:TIGR04282 family arsenosugar biosynthesis glycosyltransferase [Gammaproteobacteria bacterium]MDD9815817.1 TIGR04282 family arsenosugar biosynthesis glycosyltransferase [Gammaproteobacteria bacterium]MDD9850179.1 TIGR04282 family arsenosugar biosynthesis glycosyltransferase [Gammaproteobacteria bacterium]MDD9871212.1 TIGR04282 family arsenosugar biosynthesis glycosyltransferase [Gammaproteobacteria bacterium]
MAAERAPLLCVFAKAPLAGAVKTRLQKKCGAAVAAQIAAALAEETVRRARCHWPGQVCVYGHGAGHDSFLSQLARRHQAALRPQTGADLGERMADALRRGVAEHGAAAVLGADVPHISEEILRRAHDALQRGDNVIGPATDGGFYFAGIAGRVPPGLFRGLRWGHGEVFADTVHSCAALGLTFTVRLPALCDIDTWDNLTAAAAEVPALRRFAG